MQLILDCFKRIFEALAGVYTKQETDAALGLKADATALTEEAQRVDTRLAEHDAEIETLQKVTAGLGEGAEAAANVAKWQTYATAIQKDLDAETAMQFAQEFSRATDEYLADPTKTKDWSRTSVEVNNNPYAESIPSVLVDFSKINAAGYQSGNYRYPSFVNFEGGVVFAPNVTNLENAFSSSNNKLDVVLFVGKDTKLAFALGRSAYEGPRLFAKISLFGAKSAEKMCSLAPDELYLISPDIENINGLCGTNYGGVGSNGGREIKIFTPNVIRARYVSPKYGNALKSFVVEGGLPKADDITHMCSCYPTANGDRLTSISFVGSEPVFPKVKIAANAFSYRTKFDQFIAFPSLHTGDDMFLNAGMSAASISAVLDSLPSDPVGAGGTGVITFTGCPGAAELTQESPSVASATARGWTVEL